MEKRRQRGEGTRYRGQRIMEKVPREAEETGTRTQVERRPPISLSWEKAACRHRFTHRFGARKLKEHSLDDFWIFLWRRNLHCLLRGRRKRGRVRCWGEVEKVRKKTCLQCGGENWPGKHKKTAEQCWESIWNGLPWIIPTPIHRALWFSLGTVDRIAGFFCHVAQWSPGKYFATVLGAAMGRTLIL